MPNVLHAADFYNRSNTGITFAITSLIEQCRRLDEGSAQYGLVSVGEVDVAVPLGTLIETTSVTGRPLLRSWRYSPEYTDAVHRMISRGGMSVVHVHGAWMYPQFAAVRQAKAEKVPVILTNHGLLERWALQNPSLLSAIKKRIYLKLMAHPLFRNVDIFHAISLQNRDMLCELFPTARIEYIPNSVDIAAIDAAGGGGIDRPDVEPYILFVGRLAPEKGIDLLIQAFGTAPIPATCRLLLVGPAASENYAAYLHRLISVSPRKERIDLRRPVWGDAEKIRLMRDAWVVAVPSQSEALGLVNLEASACRTPTITTFNTGLYDWTNGGGILIEPNVRALERALMDVMAWNDAERGQRGEASRKLIVERYSTSVTGPRWIELYASLS